MTTRRFCILGATGDLTARMLLPALAQLCAAGHMRDDVEVVGLAPEGLTTEAFRARADEALAAGAADVPRTAREALVRRLTYHQADLRDTGSLRAVLGRAAEPYLAYLALPPAVFVPAVRALLEWGVPAGSRVVVEKPFGVGLAGTRALNDLVHAEFPEDAVFRVDHFLGLQTVQNLLAVRFANRVFEPLWSSQHVQAVGIAWDETLTPEGRAAYYDGTGALRDMVQSHLLQLLALVAMEPPASLTARDLRDRKVEALRAVRRLSRADVARSTRRARYTAGRVGGRPVPDYVDEPGVELARRTETFAEVMLFVDTWRWGGVPFTLRSGKALDADRQEIVVRFRPVPHLAFGQHDQPRPNELRFEIAPDRLALALELNGPGDPFSLERGLLERELAPQELGPHAQLLLAALRGDPVLSIRDDEAEESWRIVEPIAAAWDADEVPLDEYPAGTHPGGSFA